MSLNRLPATADLRDDRGRGLLQDTLEIMSQAIRNQRDELDQVINAERIQRPFPIKENPVASGALSSQVDGIRVGSIIWSGEGSTPTGYLLCDGSAVSRTTYADLFAVIGTFFGVGDGSTTFNLPDHRGRSPIGPGTGDAGGATAFTFNQKYGDQRSQSHTHDMASHTHDFDHTHRVRDDAASGSSGTKIISGVSGVGADTPADPGFLNVTTSPIGGNTTSGPSTNTTGSTHSGNSQNLHPVLCTHPFIKYLSGPTGDVQALPVMWGPVGASWLLDTVTNFPISAISDINEVATIDGLPQPVVKVTGSGGTEAGNTSQVNLIGVSKVPFNFREWRANALTLWVRVDSSGVSADTTVTLRMTDPVAGVGFLVDLLAPEERDVDACVAAGLAALEAADASVVQATAVDGSWWMGVLERAGFLRPREENHLIVILHTHDPAHPLAEAGRDASSWYLTDGDRDDETMG